jgi:sugar fermentation stimulation protein A
LAFASYLSSFEKQIQMSTESLPDNLGLPWPELIPGVLIKRYNRFLADVELSEGGGAVTAHCPNSGSMLGCKEPGSPVYISSSSNPKRKFKFTWELIDVGGSLVGINTMVPNRLVKKAILDGQIPELAQYQAVRSEVKCSDASRLDLLLEGPGLPKCYVEVKNCTLVEDGVAYFPDAVTSRGLKHVNELIELAAHGNRAVMFILIQRSDAEVFKPADHIDPAYGKRLREAVPKGVELLCYDTEITLKRIRIRRKVPFIL